MLVVAGLLVGIGTSIGNGCTSGHGICGLSRFSFRSLVATITFVGSGIFKSEDPVKRAKAIVESVTY